MTRQAVINTIKGVSMQLGYAFYCGFDYRMNQNIVAYPAAWLTPPKITNIEGRNEGVIRYKIYLHLMQISRKATEQDKDRIWDKLEIDLMTIYRKLSECDNVISIKNLECSPSELSMTNHGEIAMNISFDMEIPFFTKCM